MNLGEKVTNPVTNPKVFEYAKEIGMETLALMAKIREWQIPVKSHMAELSPEMIDAIQAKISGEKNPDAKKKVTVKKAPPRKKVVAKKETADTDS